MTGFIISEKSFFPPNGINLSRQQIELKFKETIKLLHFMVLKRGHFGKWMKNTWNVLKCVEKWGRSVGSVV
jgi:hypothetical protein